MTVSGPESESFEISQLFLHPIKSLKAISVDEVEIDEFGFKYDRCLMITLPGRDPRSHRFLTQRREPKMQLMSQSLKGTVLTLTQDGKSLDIDLRKVVEWSEKAPSVYRVDIWDEDAEGADIGELSGFRKFWLEVHGPDYKFAKATLLTPVARRNLDQWVEADQKKELDRTAETGFQDRYPGHLLATESMNDLNVRLDMQTDGEVQIKAENFRPNIVVKTNEAYEEDFWYKVEINRHIWFVPSWCPRCPIPTVNLKTGAFEPSKQPTAVLNTYRRLDDKSPGAPVFGMNMVNHDWGYKIHLGDKVTVLEKTDR